MILFQTQNIQDFFQQHRNLIKLMGVLFDSEFTTLEKRKKARGCHDIPPFCFYYQPLVETWHTISEATVTNSVFVCVKEYKNAFTSVLLKVLVMTQASQNIKNNCNIVCCQHLQYKTLCVFLTLYLKKEHFAPQQIVVVLDQKALRVLICSDSYPLCLIFLMTQNKILM